MFSAVNMLVFASTVISYSRYVCMCVCVGVCVAFVRERYLTIVLAIASECENIRNVFFTLATCTCRIHLTCTVRDI